MNENNSAFPFFVYLSFAVIISPELTPLLEFEESNTYYFSQLHVMHLALGEGNISIVSRATGISDINTTLEKVCTELKSGISLSDDKILCSNWQEVVKRLLIKTLLFCLILRHLLNQQVGDPESPFTLDLQKPSKFSRRTSEHEA